MLKLTIVTEMEFQDRAAIESYLDSAELMACTGFRKEIQIALQTGKPLAVKTPRPQFGAVTKSELRIEEFVEGPSYGSR